MTPRPRRTRAARPRRAPRASRAGFSLIELIVALTILSVGMLALVSTSLTVARQMSTANLRTEAANIAGRRFEMMRSRKYRCVDVVAGSQVWSRGITEGWRKDGVARPSYANRIGADSAIMITDSVMFTVKKSSPIKVVYQSVITCTP